MYTQCLYVSMQEVVIDISPKGSKIKNGLCKKNIVKSFPTFLGSRKSRLPLFPVSCFWRLQNQKKKHVDINYISLVSLFPWIYGVSPSFCVRLFPLPFWLGFFFGSHKKPNNNGRSQEYPKASPGRPGQRTLPNKPRPKPWFRQRWEIGGLISM